jgi:hypothetical protein
LYCGGSELCGGSKWNGLHGFGKYEGKGLRMLTMPDEGLCYLVRIGLTKKGFRQEFAVYNENF